MMKIATVEDYRKINLKVSKNETLNEHDDSEKLECDLCDFKTNKEVGLKIHKSKKHIVKCEECGKNIQSEVFLKSHICDIDSIDNPEEGDYFIDEKVDTSDCFTISRMNQANPNKILVNLHSKECWESGSCYELPLPASPNPVKNPNNVLNILVCSVINSRVVDWDKVSSLVIGFGLED